MLEIVRKTYLAGLGLAMVTAEKVEEVVDELVSKGEVAEKDRKKVVDDLMSRAREEKERLSQTVKETVKKAVADLRVPSRQQFDELVRRVEELEKRSQDQEQARGDVQTSANS